MLVFLTMSLIQSCTTLDPTRKSGRVGSKNLQERAGRVGSNSARGLNLILKCLDISILFCILVCTMFQLYNYSVSPVQFSVYIRRCGGWRICVSTLARLSNARRISCGHAAINIVVCCAVLQQAAVADGHQPLLSHFSLTCPLIKTSMRRNLTIMIVFDELVVKGEQALKRQRRCLCRDTCCAVTLIPSNSNDTASATGSAEASQFSIACRTRIAT